MEESSLRTPRLLFIEEDIFLANIYAEHLRAAGWMVEIARTGRDGLRLSASRPDAILMDILLPHGDGFSVLEQFKSDPITAEAPVFILTRLGQQRDIDRCRQLGAAGYMMKAHHLPEDVVRCLASVHSPQP
ncbi:MAG: Alkaline phosphatase synthesis transcriptional regulatory protein phoP, two-component system, OmpR [Candidatus Parcubacteria bacterium]|jgi:DNA-binding response OmpR family regulator